MEKLIQMLNSFKSRLNRQNVLKWLALSFFVLAGYQSYILFQISMINHAIQNGVAVDQNENRIPEVQFAEAWQLHQQARNQEALRVYNSIEKNASAELQDSIRYNTATLFLQKAAKQWNEHGVLAFAEVDALITLSEHSFRDVLRRNPNNLNARFNLEYALRIRPPRKEAKKSDWEGQKSSVFAILPGIPNEGP